MSKLSVRHLAAAAVLLALGSLLCWQIFATLRYQWNWSGVWADRQLLLKGWGVTVLLAAGAMVGSVLLGLLLAAGQRVKDPVIRWTCRGYVGLIRGTPLLTQLLIGYYIVANALQLDSKIVAGILLLTAFEAAYLAEILRGGVESIEKAQWDAARAVGFSRWQTWRHVILPQTLRRVLPGLAGVGASLVKDSSLLSVLGIQEFARRADMVASQHTAPLEAYLPMALSYLILTLPLTWLAGILERRWRGA